MCTTGHNLVTHLCERQNPQAFPHSKLSKHEGEYRKDGKGNVQGVGRKNDRERLSGGNEENERGAGKGGMRQGDARRGEEEEGRGGV